MDKLFEFFLGNLDAKNANIFMLVLLFLATIPTGFVFIYVHKPSLMTDLDIFKLIILSIAVTAPALLLFYLLSIGQNFITDHSFDSYELTFSSAMTLLAFGLGIIYNFYKPMSAFTHWQKTMELAGYIMLGNLIGTLIGTFFGSTRRKK